MKCKFLFARPRIFNPPLKRPPCEGQGQPQGQEKCWIQADSPLTLKGNQPAGEEKVGNCEIDPHRMLRYDIKKLSSHVI